MNRLLTTAILALMLSACGGEVSTPYATARSVIVETPAVVLGAVPLGRMTGQQYAALSSADRWKAVDIALLNHRCPDAVSYDQIRDETTAVATTGTNGTMLVVPLIVAMAVRDGCVACESLHSC